MYTLQLSKINCTNCEAKIKDNLGKEVKSGLLKVSVNILQERVNLVVQDLKTLQHCIEVLDKIGYKLIGDPVQVKTGDSSTRIVSFSYKISAASEEIEKIMRSLPGIVSVHRVHVGELIKITVGYDSNILKGTEIADVIK